jgi:hypothetical protein
MKPLALLSILVMLGPGCATDQGDSLLLGEWGGEGLAIQATRASVLVEMPCGTAGIFPSPVQLEEDGAFEFETTMRNFYGEFELYVKGNITGRQLVVVARNEYSRPPGQQFVLLSGIDPDFTDYLCLAESRE